MLRWQAQPAALLCDLPFLSQITFSLRMWKSSREVGVLPKQAVKVRMPSFPCFPFVQASLLSFVLPHAPLPVTTLQSVSDMARGTGVPLRWELKDSVLTTHSVLLRRLLTFSPPPQASPHIVLEGQEFSFSWGRLWIVRLQLWLVLLKM